MLSDGYSRADVGVIYFVNIAMFVKHIDLFVYSVNNRFRVTQYVFCVRPVKTQ